MNILFYQHQYPAFGGIETVTTLLANVFAKDGNNVLIVSFLGKEETSLLERLDNRIQCVRLPQTEIGSKHNQETLKRLVYEFAPDKIVLQDSYANIQYLLFDVLAEYRKKNNNVKLIVVEHSAPVWRITRRKKNISIGEFCRRMAYVLLKPYYSISRLRYESRRRRELFDNADAYVILSVNYKKYIRRLVGESRLHKLYVIPNPTTGVDNIQKHKKNNVLFVGSLIPLKGVSRLLSVWKDVFTKHTDWEFLIVGDGVERPKLERKVEVESIQGVRFLGFHKDPTPYYVDASLLLMASDFEGWPMVVGEAMQNGCVPLVYDTFAAAHDMIDNGVNGMIIAPFQSDKFESALDYLMSNDTVRMKWSVSARRKAANYAIDKVKSLWYELFEGL